MHLPTTAVNAASHHWVDTLRDNSHVSIRPITHDDASDERAFIQTLSSDSKRMRFLGQVNGTSEVAVSALVDVDQLRDVAFIAKSAHGSPSPIVGVSRFSTDTGGLRCECAVVVSDAWQEKGLGTLLMQHLIDVARARGIGTMYSLDASSNYRMSELAQSLGFTSRLDPDDATQTLHELLL